jgi:hypothetical protein
MHDERRSHPNDGESERGDSATPGTEPDVRRKRSRRERREQLTTQFIATAEKYVGYKARPGGLSEFGRRAGYNSHTTPWSGAFVDCVAHDAGLSFFSLPSCVYSTSGLAELLKRRRSRNTPSPGDVVFFSFSTLSADPFSMPHLGIVVDTSDWRAEKRFFSVEVVNGEVRRLLRSYHDVAAFCRPKFDVRPGRTRGLQTGIVFVSAGKVKPGARGRDVLNVQLALGRVVDLDDHVPALFDDATTVAFARWQRLTGHVGSDANGVPTRLNLERLGTESGLFSVVD